MEHTIRTKDGTDILVAKYSERRAIKYFCSECLGWDGDPKKECTSPRCPLYPYRGRAIYLTEEQRAAASARHKEIFAETGRMPGCPKRADGEPSA